MMKNGNKINDENYFDNNRLKKYINSEKHEFDRELRLLNLELLEKIELNLKKYLIIFFEENGGLENKELYQEKYLDRTLEFLKNKKEYLSKEDLEIRNFLKNNKEIKSSLFFDKLTFGEINKIFRHLKIIYRKKISKIYGINVFIFSNWFYCLKYFRNLCSHSENIFNRNMTFRLEGREFFQKFGNRNSYLVYFTVLSIFEINILNTYLWQYKVINLFEKYNIEFLKVIKTEKNLPSQLESEAWKVLVIELYKKMVKKSKVFSEKTREINIILALDSKNGLGKDGDLAWRIKEDMKYFSEITTYPQPLPNKEGGKKNAVIMGRKTWESIPEKYRPLPNRINCILSRSYEPHTSPLLIGEGIIGFNSLENAIKNLQQDENIENIFIIGGAQIYDLALKNKNLGKIYLTRVKGNYNCDVFVDFKSEDFKLIENSEWKKTKKGIEFRFEVYEKK